MKTRKREIKFIHPALAANTGSTQSTYLLECWIYAKGEAMDKEKIVCERRMDEGLRTFKDNVVGTIRTIDSGVRSE